MSTLIIDNPQFDYPAGAFPQSGRCHLRAFDQGGHIVLLVTELGDENPGASVTIAAAMIVTAAVRRYGLDPTCLTVVEHHDDRWAHSNGGERPRRGAHDSTGITGRDEGERFDRVTFAHVPSARTPLGGSPGVHAGTGAEADPLAGDAFDGPTRRRITKRQAEALVGQALP